MLTNWPSLFSNSIHKCVPRNSLPRICTKSPVETVCPFELDPFSWKGTLLLFSVVSVGELFPVPVLPFWRPFFAPPTYLTSLLPLRLRCLGKRAPGIVTLACKLIPQMFAWEMDFRFAGRAFLCFCQPSGYQGRILLREANIACVFWVCVCRRGWGGGVGGGCVYFFVLPGIHYNPENSFSKIAKGHFISRVTKSPSPSLALFLKVSLSSLKEQNVPVSFSVQITLLQES